MTPIVLLHGFAGHADSWGEVAGALRAQGARVSALTLFGHDPTAPAEREVAFEEEIARVAAAIRAMGEPVRLCGYSMGGRVALGVLTRAPDVVASAVLVGAHPGLTSNEERAQRRAADEVWARLLEDEGIEAFVRRWEALPLFASQAGAPPERLASQRHVRLSHEPRSLARAMRSLGLANMPSFWDDLEGVRVPVDFVVGELDAKFSALADQMATRTPTATARPIRVPGAGHNVVLERPERLVEVLLHT